MGFLPVQQQSLTRGLRPGLGHGLRREEEEPGLVSMWRPSKGSLLSQGPSSQGALSERAGMWAQVMPVGWHKLPSWRSSREGKCGGGSGQVPLLWLLIPSPCSFCHVSTQGGRSVRSGTCRDMEAQKGRTLAFFEGAFSDVSVSL